MDTHAGVANAAMMRQPHKNFKHGVPDTTQTPPCHVSMGMPVQSNARKHALENCQRGKARRAAGKSHHHRRCIEGGHDVKASRTALKKMPWALRHAAVQASTKRPHRMLDETRKLSGRGTADTVAAHTKALADAAVRHAGNAWVTMSTRWRRPCRHPENGNTFAPFFNWRICGPAHRAPPWRLSLRHLTNGCIFCGGCGISRQSGLSILGDNVS